MNDQPPILVTAAPPPPARKGPNISLILIVILGLGTIGFGLASIMAFGKAHTATATLADAKEAAAKEAATSQKAADDKATLIANESPYRTYTAPNAFGAFAINFPKNWNMTVDLQDNGSTQVDIKLNPEFVRKVNSIQDPLAAEVSLVRQSSTSYLARYNNKKIIQSAVTVAGITGTKLTGTFADSPETKIIVVVPVRDKTMVFTNQDVAYTNEFQTILAQAKIIP